MVALPTLRLRTQVPFPASVDGEGGITVTKENGHWTVQPDFSALDDVTGSDVLNPTAKQIWIFDPVTGVYNVLTLAGLGDALYEATSTTSLAIGTGSKTFTTQAGKDFSAGSFVLATSDADPTNYMIGQVTSYSNTTLIITVPAGGIGGSGTHADWTIRASGSLGATGATGATGKAAGLAYTWQTDTGSTDPGSGKIKVNNAALSSATALYISETDGDGNAIAALLATWDDSTNAIRGSLTIKKIGSPANFATYNITGTLTDNGAWDTFTIAHIASGGTLANNDEVTVEFTRAGNQGSGDLLSANNLSDVANSATAFANIKQLATSSATGVAKLWTLAIITSSNASWPVPSNTKEMIVEGWGAGGSGGGRGAGATATERGPGGAGGSWGMKLYQGTMDSTLNVTIGAGGTAVTGAAGNAGGTTSVVGSNFGTLSIPGGGGAAQGSTGGAAGGSTGGSATGATATIPGQGGFTTWALTNQFGAGGGAPRGGPGGTTNVGVAGAIPGGGGSGENHAGGSSGAGARGEVWIWTR